MNRRSSTGMNLRDAFTLARRLGCSVESVRRTGEVRISHAAATRRVVVNCRRRDAPRVLTNFLRGLESARTSTKAGHHDAP